MFDFCFVINEVFERRLQDETRLNLGRIAAPALLSYRHLYIPSGKNLDNNIQADILYLDFAKAFDSVDHATLEIQGSRVAACLVQ